jgi:hypothetical protein
MQQAINIFLLSVSACGVAYVIYIQGLRIGNDRALRLWMHKFYLLRSTIFDLQAQLKPYAQPITSTHNQGNTIHSYWLIFDHLKAYPDLYVAQKFENDMPTAEIFTALSLKQVRQHIPTGLFRSYPHVNCINNVVEVWL